MLIVLLLAAGLGLGYFVHGGFLLIAIAWSIQIARQHAKQRREVAVVSEQTRVLEQSQASDRRRRDALLARLAGDMRAATDQDRVRTTG